MRSRRCACADDTPKSASVVATRHVVRMPQRIATAGVGFGDSNHDPLCHGNYLTMNPTIKPATLILTSHDQNVALSNGRTLAYHPQLLTVDNAMMHNQSSVANAL